MRRGAARALLPAWQVARARVLRPTSRAATAACGRRQHQHPPHMPSVWRPRMGPAPACPGHLPNHLRGIPAGAPPKVVQGGGGACGRRPHSWSPRCRHGTRVLMPLSFEHRGARPRGGPENAGSAATLPQRSRRAAARTAARRTGRRSRTSAANLRRRLRISLNPPVHAAHGSASRPGSAPPRRWPARAARPRPGVRRGRSCRPPRPAYRCRRGAAPALRAVPS